MVEEKKRPKGKLTEGVFGRATKLLAMGSSVLSREINDRIQSKISPNNDSKLATRIKQAQDMVATLGQLKGAAMKAGQLLSLELGDLLPPEVVEILKQLHDKAPPVDFSVIEKVMIDQLGKEKFDSIQDFSTEPIASASIGQVHSGIIDGKQVAIKVQYPGVAASIDSDLALLRKVCDAILLLEGKSIDLKELFLELAEGLKVEVNYLKEAESLTEYRAMISDQYIVPEVFNDYTAPMVLTMSFIEGVRINDWLRKEKSSEERNEFGEKVVSLLLEEFFINGFVQTDPNYGNFLYQEDTKKIVLLDFGATKHYDRVFRSEIRDLLRLSYNRDKEGVLKFILEHGFISEKESDEVKDLLIDMIEECVAMFRESPQPFRYGNRHFITDLRNMTTDFIKGVKYSAPAKNMIFLNRKLGGMFHLLREADSEINLHKYWQLVDKLDLSLDHKT